MSVCVVKISLNTDLAIVTSMYSVFFSMGSAAGSAVSGAIWARRMPMELNRRLSTLDIASSAFQDPYTAADSMPWGTADRQGMVEAYKAVQLFLGCESNPTALVQTDFGMAFAIVTFCLTLALRDTLLDHKQSQSDEEEQNSQKIEDKLWRRVWM